MRASEEGLLGDQPVSRHIEHSLGFCEVLVALGLSHGDRVGEDSGGLILDLGSGAGVPGLVIAARGDLGLRMILLDSSERRTAWLRRAVERLGLSQNVEVVAERAELTGRSSHHRGSYLAVVARSFGKPALVTECGAPFLCVGGWLVVSEPPSEMPGASEPTSATGLAGGPGTALATGADLAGRWPPAELESLGLSPAQAWIARGFHYAAMRAEKPCPERYPRRTGIPAKRPLF